MYLRYHGDRSDSKKERRVSEEDEIMSAVFGTLDFISVNEAWSFWRKLFKENEIQKDFFTSPSQNIKLELWLKRKGIDQMDFLHLNGMIRASLLF